MAKIPALIVTVQIRPDFTAKIKVPLDVTPGEAHILAASIYAQANDPSDAAKFLAADPNISPEITL